VFALSPLSLSPFHFLLSPPTFCLSHMGRYLLRRQNTILDGLWNAIRQLQDGRS
jgi:hypothetical protein